MEVRDGMFEAERCKVRTEEHVGTEIGRSQEQ